MINSSITVLKKFFLSNTIDSVGTKIRVRRNSPMFDILCKMQKAKYNLWKDVFFSGRKVKAQMHHIFIAAINIDLPQHNSKYFKGPIFQKKKEKKRKRDALVQDLCDFLSQKYSVSGQKFLYIQYSMTKRKPQSVSNIYGLTGEKKF